jgi:copper homeostasis protein
MYTDGEFAEMKRAIRIAKESGMDGVVLGMLKKDRRVDIERTRELVELARPLPVTYHRAFDVCVDLRRGLEDVIQTGAARILTSGRAAGVLQGAAMFAQLVAAARGRILIVPGAGLNASDILQIVQQTRALEYHSGLSTTLPYSNQDYGTFEAEVKKLADRLREAAEFMN